MISEVAHARSPDTAMQLTVYSNVIRRKDATSGIMMILPVPCLPSDFHKIEFIDMTLHQDFFLHLDKKFVAVPSPKSSYALEATAAKKAGGMNKRHEHMVFACKTVDELIKSTPELFHLSQRTTDMIRCLFNTNYAFIASYIFHGDECMPLAFKHPLYLDDGLFLPTIQRHEHDGMLRSTVQWDHNIYTLGVTEPNTGTLPFKTSRDNMVEFSDMSVPGVNVPRRVYRCKLKKLVISGALHNDNMTLKCTETLERAMKSDVCSLTAAGPEAQLQEVYSCHACEIFLPRVICRRCMNSCHKNHVTSFVGYLYAACDCRHVVVKEDGENQNLEKKSHRSVTK
jgi:hypothetical protein